MNNILLGRGSIVVSFQPCTYCVEAADRSAIEIANPKDLPVFFRDEENEKQVYPINELRDQVTPLYRPPSQQPFN